MNRNCTLPGTRPVDVIRNRHVCHEIPCCFMCLELFFCFHQRRKKILRWSESLILFQSLITFIFSFLFFFLFWKSINERCNFFLIRNRMNWLIFSLDIFFFIKNWYLKKPVGSEEFYKMQKLAGASNIIFCCKILSCTHLLINYFVQTVKILRNLANFCCLFSYFLLGTPWSIIRDCNKILSSLYTADILYLFLITIFNVRKIFLQFSMM